MLENWCWDTSVLKRLSCHYQTKDPMPDELINSIIKAKHVAMGMQKLRQVIYFSFRADPLDFHVYL